VSRGVAVLVEKPLARTIDEANAILSLGAPRIVMPGHNMAFTPGIDAFRTRLAEGAIGRSTRASFRKRAEASSSDAPRSWNREALYQIVYHAVYVLGVATSQCAATVVRVDSSGASRPESVRAELVFANGCRGEIAFDFGAAAPSDELEAFDASGRRLAWLRDRDGETLSFETPNGERTGSVPRGNDIERMLGAFRDAMLDGRALPVTAADARDTMATAEAIVAMLADQIARPNAPKHVASPSLR
jgi:predicted dehydrogenase